MSPDPGSNTHKHISGAVMCNPKLKDANSRNGKGLIHQL